MSIIKHLDASTIKINNFKLNQKLDNTVILCKKTRKKTIIEYEHRCKAFINNGKQCSRRKKYGEFCGKHKNKQQYGISNHNNQTNESKTIKSNFYTENDNFIEVKKFKINNEDYFIDKNNIIFNKKGTKIIGRLNNNNEIYTI